MDSEEDNDSLAQKEEVEILAEILDPGCFSAANNDKTISGHLDTKVRIEGTILHVKCPKYEAENNDDQLWELEHLPPLTLHFTLPPDYPSNSKPIFTLSSNWLSPEALSVWCRKLDDLWEENKGMPVLFKWHSYLKDDALPSLGFTSQGVYHLSTVIQSPETEIAEKSRQTDPRAISETCTEMTLLEYLVGYDHYQRQTEFHSCPVCLTEKRGSDCITLSRCLHVFCVECLKDYFSMHVTEGSLDSVKCPHLDCQLVPSHKELKTLVGPELFHRYDTLLLNRGLDRMQDVTTCPRISCQQPVILPDDPKDKLGECSSCGYAFCKYCKLLYHGVEYCPSPEDEAELLYEKYVTSSEKVRETLEIMYGKETFLMGEVFEQVCEKYVNGTEVERRLLEKDYGKEKFLTGEVWARMYQKYLHGNGRERKLLEKEYGKKKFLTGEIFDKIYQKYLNGTKKERELLEKEYGKEIFLTEEVIQKRQPKYENGTVEKSLVLQRRREARFSQRWIQSNTKACPKCDTQIEKNGGCNHMKCWKCSADFNWEPDA